VDKGAVGHHTFPVTVTDERLNTERDNLLWQQCWRDNDTDFHQKTVNANLIKFWPTLDLKPGARVFVPLCGKSLDLSWLAAQGHSVIGVELSPIAVRAFFKSNRMQPSRCKHGKFTLWQNGRIDILCGDLFDLVASDLGDIAAVFDRASLTALPENIRHAYLAHLRKIIPAASKILLLTTEEPDEDENQGQPFAIAEEIRGLYDLAYHIEISHVESVFEADANPGIKELVRVEQKVYLLSPK
jgi:thiopurine S-methyltransferase